RPCLGQATVGHRPRPPCVCPCFRVGNYADTWRNRPMINRSRVALGRIIPALVLIGCMVLVTGSLFGRSGVGRAAPAAAPTGTATPNAPTASPTMTPNAPTASPTATPNAPTSSPTASPSSGTVTLVVTPAQIAAGSKVAVTGKGYQAGEQVALQL